MYCIIFDVVAEVFWKNWRASNRECWQSNFSWNDSSVAVPAGNAPTDTNQPNQLHFQPMNPDSSTGSLAGGGTQDASSATSTRSQFCLFLTNEGWKHPIFIPWLGVQRVFMLSHQVLILSGGCQFSTLTHCDHLLHSTSSAQLELIIWNIRQNAQAPSSPRVNGTWIRMSNHLTLKKKTEPCILLARNWKKNLASADGTSFHPRPLSTITCPSLVMGSLWPMRLIDNRLAGSLS